MKETINIVELFEKYRKSMTPENIGWSPNDSFEEYMSLEGYERGVALFLERLESVTNGEFIDFDSKEIPLENSFDSDYLECICKRKDGKLFRYDLCIEFGRYSTEMVEVKPYTEIVKTTYYK